VFLSFCSCRTKRKHSRHRANRLHGNMALRYVFDQLKRTGLYEELNRTMASFGITTVEQATRDILWRPPQADERHSVE